MAPPRRSEAGALVAVEGIDGSGKSTVARQVVDMLEELGLRAVLFDRQSAPDALDGYPAEHLRQLRHLIWEYPETARTSELGFEHWAHLLVSWFSAVDHTVIRPAVEQGLCVVADSWYYKFVARFALTIGLTEAERLFRGISTPDVVVWLDTAPELCLGRRGTLRSTERGEWQHLDGGGAAFLEYQRNVRRMYRRLASGSSWEVVESTDPSSVTSDLRSRLARIRLVERSPQIQIGAS